MTLTVLTDDEIRSLLENLTLDDLEGFSEALASALYEYSTSVPGDGGGEGGASDTRQPERASVRHPDIGVTTLFMPSSNSAGNAVKGMLYSVPTKEFLFIPTFTYFVLFLFLSRPTKLTSSPRGY